MALLKLEGRITVPTGGYDLELSEGGVGVGTVTIGAANYYLSSPTSLTSELKEQLDAVGAGTYTVTLDDDTDTATGKVTISVTGVANYSIVWTDTALRDLYGFTSNITTQTTATGAYQAPNLWLPNTDRSRVLSPVPASTSYSLGARVRDFSFAIAPSGESKALSYSTRYVDALEFAGLVASKVWQSQESVVNESLETFYEDVIGVGTQFRFHPDRSDNAVYWDMRVSNAQDFRPVPVRQEWTGSNSLWSVSYEMHKVP